MATYGNVVNPDQVSLVEGDGVTTPDVLGVDVGDSNVPVGIPWLVCDGSNVCSPGRCILDDDVGDTADHAETTALDDTAGTLTDQGLVGVDGDTEFTSSVAILLSAFPLP